MKKAKRVIVIGAMMGAMAIAAVPALAAERGGDPLGSRWSDEGGMGNSWSDEGGMGNSWSDEGGMGNSWSDEGGRHTLR